MSDMKDENIIILYQCSVTVDSIVKSDVLAYRQCLFSYYVMLKCVIHRRPAVYDLTGVFALLLVQISLPFSVINVMILLSAASVVYLSMLHTQFMRYNCRCCGLKAKLVSHCNC